MKKKTKRIITFSVLGAFLLVILIPIIGYVILINIKTNPDRPQKIDNPTGYVQAVGENLYDGDGNILQFEGVNLGNWFVQEYWMNVSSVGNFETGIYTQKRGIEAMRQNPNLTEENIDELYRAYMDNYIRTSDIEEIAQLGFNTVRVPFSYLNLTYDGIIWREDAFRYLDWVITQCKNNGLYVILDLHGGVGSQNQDHHSGDDAQFNLYGNRENMDATIEIWKVLAERYKNEKTVAGYDLLNEPRNAEGQYAGKVQFDFYDELYKAIREIDCNHMILMECFTFPVHGVSETNYNWTNICYEYHIYNLTLLSQKSALNFYKALHNLRGYKVPVLIGEWNAWENDEDWQISVDFFNELGWSFCSWTYKTDAYSYTHGDVDNYNSWGLYELDIKPVDISSATFEEIYAAYSAMKTENANRTHVYYFYENYFKTENVSE